MSNYKRGMLTPQGKERLLNEGLDIVNEEGTGVAKLTFEKFTEGIAKRAGQIVILNSLDDAIKSSNTYVDFLVTGDKVSGRKSISEATERAINLHNELCDHFLDRMLEFLTDKEVESILKVK